MKVICHILAKVFWPILVVTLAIHNVAVMASAAESMLDEPPNAVIQRAKALQPNRELSYLGSENIVGSDSVWSSFHFGSAADSSALSYGSVHVLWGRQSGAPSWAFNWFGDFQPHSISLLDLDRDGDLDLFFLAGYEDVFETHVYLQMLNQAETELYKSVYVNQNDYSVLLDFDGDGQAEILDSGHHGKDHVEGLCNGEVFTLPTIPESVLFALMAEYRRISGRLDRYNFKYGMPDRYPAMSMAIFDPIRILRIERGEPVDVTRQFERHLLWRIEQLSKIRSVNNAECLPLIDKAILHLKGLLKT